MAEKEDYTKDKGDDGEDGEDAGVHASSHENEGTDEISVAGLSGLLADEQDAGKIKGVVVDDSAKADTYGLVFDEASGKIIYAAPAVG